MRLSGRLRSGTMDSELRSCHRSLCLIVATEGVAGLRLKWSCVFVDRANDCLLESVFVGCGMI